MKCDLCTRPSYTIQREHFVIYILNDVDCALGVSVVVKEESRLHTDDAVRNTAQHRRVRHQLNEDKLRSGFSVSNVFAFWVYLFGQLTKECCTLSRSLGRNWNVFSMSAWVMEYAWMPWHQMTQYIWELNNVVRTVNSNLQFVVVAISHLREFYRISRVQCTAARNLSLNTHR